MSIANEIERLSTAKNAIAESIAAKGIAVPSSTKLDEMAPLIDSIKSSIWSQEIPGSNTYIFVHLEDGRTSPAVGCAVNGTLIVDWGDGTERDVLNGTSNAKVIYTNPHLYKEPGDYMITLAVVEGGIVICGDSARWSTSLLAASDTQTYKDLVYSYSIKKVVIGRDAQVRSFGLTSYSLSSVTFSKDVNKVFNNALMGDLALANVTFLGDVNVVLSNAFRQCSGVAYYDFSACTKVPSLESTSAFDFIADDCKIRVPAALYDEWVAATNWASLAEHIVAV